MRGISERFRALSPYDTRIVKGSILKIEDENYRGKTQRQLFAYAISAKRYALFARAKNGRIAIVKKSDHGLGHLLNPIDPESDNTDWIGETWQYLIAKALRIPVREPPGIDRPAISRITISSPHLHRPFASDAKPYRARVKPFNFALSAQVAPFGHPEGADPTCFHLIAPYERDARRWLRIPWTEMHSGDQYMIRTGTTVGGQAVRVKSFRDVLASYATHPEPKSAASDGSVCGRGTKGLLQRRVVHVTNIVYVGKESNRVEDVEQGLVHDWDDVQQVIGGSFGTLRARMQDIVVTKLAKRTGLSVRQLKRIRNGGSIPSLAAGERIERSLDATNW